jgi:hypothetical protein
VKSCSAPGGHDRSIAIKKFASWCWRALSRRTEAGHSYGVITAKALAVLQALWGFHNARTI